MATINVSGVPAVLMTTNNTDKDVSLPIYPDNGSMLLAVGDSLIYQVKDSREFLYYYTTCKSLGLSLAEVDTDSELEEMVISAKAATAPADANQAAAAVNQAAVTVSTNGNTINLAAKLDSMNSYASTSGRGTAKWFGLLISTGESTIEGMLYNGTALTSADVTEASACGGTAGDIILWLEMEKVVAEPKTISLAVEGKATASITIRATKVA